ncbi:unnamed protein product, partial [Cyprideis torosa]
CLSGINIGDSENTTFTYDYEHQLGTAYPRGSTANVTCTIDFPNCQRTFQAECGGRYGWYLKLFNMSHLEFCEPCTECFYPPPEPTPCTRFVEPYNESIPYSHGDVVQYELLGQPGLVVNATCDDGYWDFPGIPERYIENLVYSCATPEECSTFWTYPNGTNISVTLFTATGNEPDMTGTCNELFDLDSLRTAPCNESKHFVCMIDESQNFVEECPTPLNPKICNSTHFVFDEQPVGVGTSYPVGTVAELTCSRGTVQAECLGEPLGWFFHNDSLAACGICEPGDCLYPPPKTPCGIPAEEIHQAPFQDGESFRFNCPQGNEANVTCMNGTWVGGCEEDPHVFGIGDECFVVRPQMDTIENQAVFCNNLSQGYLAPASSDPVGINDSLTDILEPADHLFLGTQLTYNESAYTCSGNDCNSLWKDEHGESLTSLETVPGTDPNKCLILDTRNGTYRNQECVSPQLYICRIQPPDISFECGEVPSITDHVPTNQSNDFGARIDVDYSCPCDNGTGTVPAVCLGHPVGWLFPRGIHICDICTTTESTTMETTTDSTTLPSTSDSTTARAASTSTPSETATESSTSNPTTDSATISSTEATSTKEPTSTAAHQKREYSPTPAIKLSGITSMSECESD